MQEKILRCLVALVTPFKENGEIDFASFSHLIEDQIEAGTEGLVIGGSTGEGATLSFEERCALFERAAEIGKGKLFLIGATGTNQTRESVLLTRRGKELGLDGAMAIVPYYNKPTPEGVVSHFSALSEVGVPLLVYHHPGRTGIRLSLKTIETILALPNVVGFKDSSMDLPLIQELILQGHRVYSGDDDHCLAQIGVGATGSISVIGNFLPSAWKGWIDLAIKGDWEGAKKGYYALYPLLRAIGLETNPQCIKYLVSTTGRCLPVLRLPLLLPTKATQLALEGAALESSRLLDQLGNQSCPTCLVGGS